MESITFGTGWEQKESEIQKLYKEREDCGNRLSKYKNNKFIKGTV